jgi:hypothetical protein
MRTARQREASRINGARSRGPVTSIGKQKSSRNSRRHGLYAKDFPAAPPSGELSALHDQLEANSPNSEYERLLQCTLDAHRDRMRIVSLETRIMTEEIDRQRLLHPEESEVSLAALAFRRLANETGTIDALYRFEGVTMRRHERAQRNLDRWHRLQPVISENEICGTNLGPVPEGSEPDIEPIEICGTNLTSHRICRPRITRLKRTYNRRVASKERMSKGKPLMSGKVPALVLTGMIALLFAAAALAQSPTMKQLMLDLIHPASNDILLTVSRGGPSNDNEWASLRHNALTLSESGNVLMAAQSGSDAWVEAAKLLTDAGSDAYKAAQSKDAKALAAITTRIDASCTNCHKQFRPNVFPRQGGQ